MISFHSGTRRVFSKLPKTEGWSEKKMEDWEDLVRKKTEIDSGSFAEGAQKPRKKEPLT